MRAAFRLTSCVAALVMAGACAPKETTPADGPKGPTPAEMTAAADALDQRFVDAFNKDDADALMATYWNNPNLVSIGLDGSAPRGWDTTSAAWHASMDGNPQSVLEYFDSQQRSPRGGRDRLGSMEDHDGLGRRGAGRPAGKLLQCQGLS